MGGSAISKANLHSTIFRLKRFSQTKDEMQKRNLHSTIFRLKHK